MFGHDLTCWQLAKELFNMHKLPKIRKYISFLTCWQVKTEAENRPYWMASYMIPHVEQYTTSPNTTV